MCGMVKYIFRRKFLYMFLIIVMLLSSLLSVRVAFIAGNIIDLLSDNNFTNSLFNILVKSFLILILWVGVNFIGNVIKAKLLKGIMLDFKADVFTKISNLSITEFQNNTSTYYVSIINNDINTLEENYFNHILSIVSEILLLFISIITLFTINIYIALIAIATSIIPLLIPKLTNKKLSLLRSEFSKDTKSFISMVKETILGIETIKSYNINKQISDIYINKNEQMKETEQEISVLEGIIQAISILAGFSMYFIVLTLGIYLAYKKIITVGTVIVASQLTNNIKNPIINIILRINTIKSTKPIIEKIDNISTGEVEDKGKISKEYFEDKITFSELSFSYDGKKNAIEDMNLEIQKGKKYAIVGQTGSGKSTILKLLLNYFSEYSGEIKIDGINIKDIKLESLYKLISIIQQNVFLFEDTIKENITLYQPYKENEINKAIYLSGLEEMVNSLENNVNTYVGEAGNKLSGGEKQRISIARALIKKTPILLLDEATGSLDNKTAYNIESSLLELEDETLIVVTHRLNDELLKKYDNIIVMKNGSIVEQGNLQELMDNKKYFYSLYLIEMKKVADKAEV